MIEIRYIMNIGIHQNLQQLLIPCSLPCKLLMRCYAQTEPTRPVSNLILPCRIHSHQIEIVLHKILLETIQWKCTMPHALNEFVVSKLLPDILNVGTVQHIFNETTT